MNFNVAVRKCNGWWDCIVGISKFFVNICAAPTLLGGIGICLGLLKGPINGFRIGANGGQS